MGGYEPCVGNLLRAQRKGALTALHNAGAHFVLCDKTKRATTEKWQETPADLSKVTRGAGYRGIVPSSLQSIVVDVDRGGQTAVQEVSEILGTPLAVLPSKTKGRCHLWYKCHDAKAVGNSNWRGGELRGGKGYAIIYNPAALIRAIRSNTGEPISAADLVRLPPADKSGGQPRAGAGYQKGSRNKSLNADVFKAVVRGNDAAVQEAANTARAAGLSDKEIADTVKSATKGAEKALADEAKAGVFYLTVDGLKKALAFIGVNCRHNTRSHRLQWGPVATTPNELNLDEWTDSTDRLKAAIQHVLSIRCRTPSRKKDDPPAPYSLSRDRWPQYLNAILYEREVDPFQEYLLNLEFDGTQIDRLSEEMFRELAPMCSSELDEWLEQVFEFADGANDLTRWVSRFLFLGPVQRTMEPGCQLAEMPVLVGPQKLGKSPMIKALLPPEFVNDGFADNLKLTDHNKQFAENLQGRIVIEVAEMAGAGRAHLDHLKAALSRQDDGGVRLAYRTDPEPMPRRCVMVGTANEPCLPNDPTGNRRFAVVELVSSTSGLPARAKVCVEDYLAERRDRLWALAVIAWRGGERANLPTSLATMQAEANTAYRMADTQVEDIVAERQNVLVKRFYETGERGLTMQQIAEGLWDERADYMRNQTRMENRVGTALRMPPHEWKSGQRRVDGKRAVRWFPHADLLKLYPREDAQISSAELAVIEAEAAVEAARNLADAERDGAKF